MTQANANTDSANRRPADGICVIQGSRIVERGTHDELLARGGLYCDLYDRQFVDL